jgi:hypothetical protein
MRDFVTRRSSLTRIVNNEIPKEDSAADIDNGIEALVEVILRLVEPANLNEFLQDPPAFFHHLKSHLFLSFLPDNHHTIIHIIVYILSFWMPSRYKINRCPSLKKHRPLRF